jgi:protein-disulfide isomerase
MRACFLAACLAFWALTVTAGPTEDGRHEVAIVGTTPITAAELDKAVGNQLVGLQTEEFETKQRILEKMIADALFAREAIVRGITVEELIRSEIDGKARPVTEADVRTTYENYKPQLQSMPEADALRSVEQALRASRVEERRAAFLKTLRSREQVKVLLEPPRVSVTEGDFPTRGPKGAPVTIVEFSDFQCPYCRAVAPTLKELEKRYGDRVRFVFRDFPLDMHKDAARAAEAGACAREQGKFWEMHDWIFAHQGNLGAEQLKGHAGEVGLDQEAFGVCLDSRKFADLWRASSEEGGRYGVSATPTFFINGRVLSGARPLGAFSEIIDDELSRAGVPSTPESSTAPAGAEGPR